MNFQSTLEVTSILEPLDWTLFFLVLILTFASILIGHKKRKSGNQKENFIDHLLMGRQLTLPLFISTLVATWYGGIFGVTEIAFSSGIYNFITQGFFWYITYIIFAFALVHRIKKYKSITLPDMVEQLVGKKSAKLASWFNLVNVLPIAYIISLGLFIDLLTGWGQAISALTGIVIVLLYSTGGGFRSVIFSDIIQFFVMCLAVFFVLAFSMSTFGGYGFLKTNLDPSYFSATGTYSWSQTIAWGFIALSTLVDPNFYQRCFAAKDVKTAKNGILISTVIWFCFDICTTFGAMYAKAVIPEAESTQAYLIYALQILPSGLRGFFLAGILATILSTLDSYLFLAGTTLSFDILKKRMNNAINSQRLSVIIVSIFAFALSLAFDGNIKKVWKLLGSYSASCLLIPVLYAQLRPNRLKDNQFITISLSALITTTLWILFKPSGWAADIDELYVGMLTSIIAITILQPRKLSSF